MHCLHSGKIGPFVHNQRPLHITNTAHRGALHEVLSEALLRDPHPSGSAIEPILQMKKLKAPNSQ